MPSLKSSRLTGLTLINWKGFFIRKFDLDPIITTLSGGNGAGKSTVLSAFMTALIPDLSLLSFRNTTEPRASSASRDRGLHGKLAPGCCYAFIEFNHGNHRPALAGVRLQTLSAREGKVSLRPFILESLPQGLNPAELFTEMLPGSVQVKVIDLKQVQEKLAALGGKLELPSSLTEYHQRLFQLGVLPKPFRNPSERSKLYKLLEASLCGGLPAHLARSIKDYLLTEQIGIKRAFKQLEAALQENRLTQWTLKETEATRDLFKQLIWNSLTYVSSDRMRLERRYQEQHQGVVLSRQRKQAYERERAENERLKIEYLRQQSEVQSENVGLQESLELLNHRTALAKVLKEQLARMELLRGESETLKEQLKESLLLEQRSKSSSETANLQLKEQQSQIDGLRKALADQNLALEAHQWKWLQKKKAEAVLEGAAAYFPSLNLQEKSKLKPEIFEAELGNIKASIEALQPKQWTLQQQLEQGKAWEAKVQEAQALIQALSQALEQVEPPHLTPLAFRNFLLEEALKRERLSHKRYEWEEQLRRLQADKQRKDQLLKLWNRYETARKTRQAPPLGFKELDAEKVKLHPFYEKQREQLRLIQEATLAKEKEIWSVEALLKPLSSQKLLWSKAQEALEHFQLQTGQTFPNKEELQSFLESAREALRTTEQKRFSLEAERSSLDQTISNLRLQTLEGTENSALKTVADALGGELLCTALDRLSLEEAPYFSALLNPFSEAILVEDVEAAKAQINPLPLPEQEFYLLPKDPFALTPEAPFEVESGTEGVWSRFKGTPILRYTPFSPLPWAGAAAREEKLKALEEQYRNLSETILGIERESERIKRVIHLGERLIFQQGEALFLPSPHQEEARLLLEGTRLKEELAQLHQRKEQLKPLLALLEQETELLDQLLNAQGLELLQEEETPDQVPEICLKLEEAKAAEQWWKRNTPLYQKLRDLPDLFFEQSSLNLDEIRGNLESLKQKHQKLLEKQALFEELLQRFPALSYELTASRDSPNRRIEELKNQLASLEAQLPLYLQKAKQASDSLQVQLQKRLKLEATFQGKQELLNSLQKELDAMKKEIPPEEQTLFSGAQLEAHYREKQGETRVRLSQKQRELLELNQKLLQIETTLRKLQEEEELRKARYLALRKQLLQTKEEKVKISLISQREGLASLLFRPSLLSKADEELRRDSDHALGSLRSLKLPHEGVQKLLASADGLRHSTLRKVEFFVYILQYLRDRIRKDIFQTQDPIEALEAMEAELVRLESDLKSRAEKITLSRKGLAQLIQQSIQREQLRIERLNAKLKGAKFGEILSVRLKLELLPTHAKLLTRLLEETPLPLYKQEGKPSPALAQEVGFFENLGNLYSALVPEARLSQQTLAATQLGESLLDYRNYLRILIEVERREQGWIQADSGLLSTGEAIGTGMTVLMMILHSWEEEALRLRANRVACRFLLLDEAARLDTHSIQTLYELCQRLNTQLLLAAPEEVAPGKGTTYQLKRHLLPDGRPHVQVIGLRKSPPVPDWEEEASDEIQATLFEAEETERTLP